MNIREILCEDEDWFHVLQGRDKWQEDFELCDESLDPVNRDIFDQVVSTGCFNVPCMC
jgi:hypothetical protein